MTRRRRTQRKTKRERKADHKKRQQRSKQRTRPWTEGSPLKNHPLGFDDNPPNLSRLFEYRTVPRKCRVPHGLSANQVLQLQRCAGKLMTEEKLHRLGKSGHSIYPMKMAFFLPPNKLVMLLDDPFVEQQHNPIVRCTAAMRLFAITINTPAVLWIAESTQLPGNCYGKSDLPDGLNCVLLLRYHHAMFSWASAAKRNAKGVIEGFEDSSAPGSEVPVQRTMPFATPWTLEMMIWHEFFFNHEAVAQFLDVPADPYFVWKAQQDRTFGYSDKMAVLNVSHESLTRCVKVTTLEAFLGEKAE